MKDFVFYRYLEKKTKISNVYTIYIDQKVSNTWNFIMYRKC